jgi:glyoxylate utilization-related uncharacterized protein
MKCARLLVCLSFTLLSAAAFAGEKKTSNAVFVEAKDIPWQDVVGFAGVQSASVEGDAAKGPHHAFMKFKGGFAAPLHHHTANHFMTVIAGTLVLTVDGQEHRLPAGSYFSFKNKGQHSTSCAAGDDCVLFGDVRGKWDVVPEKK